MYTFIFMAPKVRLTSAPVNRLYILGIRIVETWSKIFTVSQFTLLNESVLMKQKNTTWCISLSIRLIAVANSHVAPAIGPTTNFNLSNIQYSNCYLHFINYRLKCFIIMSECIMKVKFGMYKYLTVRVTLCVRLPEKSTTMINKTIDNTHQNLPFECCSDCLSLFIYFCIYTLLQDNNKKTMFAELCWIFDQMYRIHQIEQMADLSFFLVIYNLVKQKIFLHV